MESRIDIPAKQAFKESLKTDLWIYFEFDRYFFLLKTTRYMTSHMHYITWSVSVQ